MRKSLLFWLIYAGAWIMIAASHFSFFLTHLGQSFFEAFKGAVFNIGPGAVFGIVIVMACRRLPWSQNRRRVFILVHLLLLSLYVALWGFIERATFSAVLIYVSIAGVVYAIQANERLRIEEARATQAENLRTRAELEALRSQLNPHFLFNTLHSLMALVRHNPPAAEDALEKLALLLRHTLVAKQDAEDVLFSEELDFIQNYLALEQIRLGNRLRFEEVIGADTLTCLLPPLTLQPLVENSVKHSIAVRPEGGLLRLTAQRRDGWLLLEVYDDGPGAELEELDTSTGSGLKITQQRLKIRFGDTASFKVITQSQKGFAVRMAIPAD
jgi:LytS/YehU family sensor histidine kinase